MVVSETNSGGGRMGAEQILVWVEPSPSPLPPLAALLLIIEAIYPVTVDHLSCTLFYP